MTFSTPTRMFTGLMALVFGAILASSCSINKPNYDNLSATERAVQITKNRKKAVEQIGIYKASGYENVEALKKAVEYERNTTKISPNGCPSCFREYGKALSILGHHYRVLHEQVLEDLEVSESRAEELDLEDEAAEYDGLMQQYFEESNKAYRVYFNNPDTPIINPREIERVMRHHEFLEEYEMALVYLGRLSRVALTGVNDAEIRLAIEQNIDALQKFYKRKLQEQRERTYRDQQGNGNAPGESPTRRRVLRTRSSERTGRSSERTESSPSGRWERSPNR